jgi:hypothetical protein
LEEQCLDFQVFSFAAKFVILGTEQLLLLLGQLIEAIKVISVTTNLKEQSKRLDNEQTNRYNESFLLPEHHQ